MEHAKQKAETRLRIVIHVGRVRLEMIELAEQWGPRLFAVAVIYAIVSLIVTYSLLSIGIEPPPLVPAPILSLFKSAEESWSSIAGNVYSGTQVLTLLTNILNSAFKLSIAVFGAIVVSYIWLAVMISATLPPPLNILVIPIWVGAVFANTILILYLAMKIRDMVQSIVGV